LGRKWFIHKELHMGSHPLNLGLRFLLEIATLVAAGRWGWQKTDGWSRYALAAGIPLAIAALWGTFRVPRDPGAAPVAVPGVLRLVFELAVFAFAVWALADVRRPGLAWAMGIIVGLHYIVSYDRVQWLLRQ
jgi:hypothetical protein